MIDVQTSCSWLKPLHLCVCECFLCQWMNVFMFYADCGEEGRGGERLSESQHWTQAGLLPLQPAAGDLSWPHRYHTKAKSNMVYIWTQTTKKTTLKIIAVDYIYIYIFIHHILFCDCLKRVIKRQKVAWLEDFFFPAKSFFKSVLHLTLNEIIYHSAEQS